MIRNVVMGRLRSGDTAAQAQLDEGLAGIARLDLPGQRSMQIGRDAGLREGGWSFVIINDWDDAAAYHAYDADPEHNDYRRLIGAACSDLARVQFEVN